MNYIPSSVGPGITDHMVLASISTHLHISKDSAMGQQTSMSLIEKNPAAYINPNQPLMSKVEGVSCLKGNHHDVHLQ